MSRIHVAYKIAAVGTSLILVGLLITGTFDQLGFDWLRKPSEAKDPDLLPGSKSGKIGFSGKPLAPPEELPADPSPPAIDVWSDEFLFNLPSEPK